MTKDIRFNLKYARIISIGEDKDPVIFALPDPVLFWPDMDPTPIYLSIGHTAYISSKYRNLSKISKKFRCYNLVDQK